MISLIARLVQIVCVGVSVLALGGCSWLLPEDTLYSPVTLPTQNESALVGTWVNTASPAGQTPDATDQIVLSGDGKAVFTNVDLTDDVGSTCGPVSGVGTWWMKPANDGISLRLPPVFSGVEGCFNSYGFIFGRVKDELVLIRFIDDPDQPGTARVWSKQE